MSDHTHVLSRAQVRRGDTRGGDVAKKPVEESNEIQFTSEEVNALRLIVTDWLNEGLMLPP